MKKQYVIVFDLLFFTHPALNPESFRDADALHRLRFLPGLNKK